MYKGTTKHACISDRPGMSRGIVAGGSSAFTSQICFTAVHTAYALRLQSTSLQHTLLPCGIANPPPPSLPPSYLRSPPPTHSLTLTHTLTRSIPHPHSLTHSLTLSLTLTLTLLVTVCESCRAVQRSGDPLHVHARGHNTTYI